VQLVAETTTAPSVSPLKGETELEEPGRLPAAIARRAAEIRATVPDLELDADVELGAALAGARADGVSVTALLVHAAARALRELPWANAAYRDGRFERYGRVNVGVVVTTADALVMPTVLDADTKSPAQLTEEIARLQDRARDGELTPPEQSGATFTLSDFSELGARRVTPLITPPQAAALTAGAIRPTPVLAGDGTVTAGEVMTLALACDHRILFGARAAQLLGRIADHLREPAS
jgi:pyruvate dehydrogenase E2 component (dihydrolipoamide acetyltransferase)